LLLRLIAVGLLLAGIYSPQTLALDSKEIYQLNEERVFQIRVLNRETGKKSSIGSGFIVGSGSQMATNYHVISQIILEPEVFYISFTGKDGQEGELKLLGLDVAHDLALLGADKPIGEEPDR